jgi:sugar/nucleoside kinase (ribokinase family)
MVYNFVVKSVRLDRLLDKVLSDYAKTMGKSKSDVVRELIYDFLNNSNVKISHYVTNNKFDKMFTFILDKDTDKKILKYTLEKKIAYGTLVRDLIYTYLVS